MERFGELRRLGPREIWSKEAYEFTPWLAQNLERLGEALGLELELLEREADVGDFSLDLLATDLGTGRTVIIENQLDPTDHDHLGKLLTYAAGHDAAVVVWISERLRDEHRQALEWLNQRTDANTDFFGVVIEVLRIDDSRPAINFQPVVFPNAWRKQEQRAPAQPPSSKGLAYQAFFQDLIDELRERHQFTTARVGQPQNWYSFSSGISGIKYGVSFTGDARVKAELYIDVGVADKNKRLFELLLAERPSIESAFGGPLQWERLDDRRASRVAVYRDGSIGSDPVELALIRSWAVGELIKLKALFGPRLRGLVDLVEEEVGFVAE